MASYTDNYNLKKPADDDFYTVEDFNNNADLIDAALKEHDDALDALDTGKADLENGKVKNSQLPAATYQEGYLYNGVFYKEAAHTTAITGAAGIDYMDLSTNVHYRWSGSAYVKTGTPVELGETSGKAYRGDRGKVAYEHTSKSVMDADGAHDLRYSNNRLQVFNDGAWENANAGGGVSPQVVVNVTTGSAVSATDGTTTITGTAASGSCTLDIPNFGTWTITATLNGQTVSDTVVIDTAKVYTIGLSYFSATINVTALAGSVVTITNGTTSDSGTVPSGGTISFMVRTAGTWSVSATYDGVTSNTATVNATTDGGSYSTSVSFIRLTVTIDSGSSVTVSKGSVTKTATSTGTAVFYLPSTGTWTVTATKSGNTATDTISISGYANYSLTLAYYKYVGVKIQIGSSATDPASAVTYIDDAVGMSTGYDAWKNHAIFKNIKPCVVKDGVVQYYLDPTNLALKEDGTAATITTTSGDVMIEIPKLGYKMTTDGSYHYIYVTDDPAADGYCYRAHALDSEGDCDKIYIGAYLAYLTNSKLYSISGQTPTTNNTLSTYRNCAAARGTGYQLLSFYPLTLLQCLYLIMYKNRNGQSALGRGYVDGNSAVTKTGNTNAKGVCYGETTGKYQMCFLNIEDFWGNALQWIDGIFSNSSYAILTDFKNFNDSGSSYSYSKSSGISSNIGNYMSNIVGTNEGGFVAKEVSGSATTFYADHGYLGASRLAYFGGSYSDGDGAGPFRLTVYYSASTTRAFLGARLIYKHKAS